MMKSGNILIKYISFVLCTLFTFMMFIACGSQLYKISMESDFDNARAEKSNPKVNDVTSTVYGIHAITGWKKIPIKFRIGPEMSPEQRSHLYAAMKTWEWATGKTLFVFDGLDKSTGDSFPDLFTSLNDSVNGHYLDRNWKKTKKPDYVLATTIWLNDAINKEAISQSDIRFNTQNYLIGDSLVLKQTDDKDVVDMQSLALHELGHFLGLAHVNSKVDPDSVMNPSLFIGEGLTTRELSQGDIQRIQTVYGCEGKACNIEELVAEASHKKNTTTLNPIDPYTGNPLENTKISH
ncbi:MAG: matrixin family metalloprotease [Oligoflexales bacterium]|nr:matrixin family metalloprotease [Oligoflexales bacterium]